MPVQAANVPIAPIVSSAIQNRPITFRTLIVLRSDIEYFFMEIDPPEKLVDKANKRIILQV